jgi:RIO-like serine/threonine protein kinase
VEKEVLAAFEEIHALNVIHGDVRSANILVAEGGNKVWVIDFEDGQILGDGDEKRESEISNEMEAVCEMLQDINKRSGRDSCLRLPESEIPTALVSSLEVF